MNSTDFSSGTIFIPKIYCNDRVNSGLSDIQLAGRFIHELMHGYMATLLRDKYPGALPVDFLIPDPHNPDNFISNPTYCSDLVKGFNNVEEVDGSHHVLFFTHFKGFIMDALHILNGKIGNPADYEYLAHIIINTDDLGTSPWNAQLGLGYKDSETGKYISTFDKNKYINAWNNIGGDAGFKLKCE